MNRCDWGLEWMKGIEGQLKPMMMDIPMAPEHLLKITGCANVPKTCVHVKRIDQYLWPVQVSICYNMT